MAEVASHWFFITETQRGFQASQCRIFGRESDTGIDFSLGTSVFLCFYYFINTHFSFFCHHNYSIWS